MKKARLDQILLGMGAVTEEQIRKALLRQKSRGGRLGTHLLYYRYVSEELLVTALAEQFGVGGVRLGGREIPDEVVRRVPADVAEGHLAIPFLFDRERGELHVAIADPEDSNAVTLIRRASGTPRVVVHVAPEIGIRNKIAFHYHGQRERPGVVQAVDLPDLFASEPGGGVPSAAPEPEDAGGRHPASLLMYTGQVFLSNVLPALFEREGSRLTVVTATGRIADALRTAHYGRILVSEDVREEFERFVAEHRSHSVFPEVTYFRTLAGALLDNPAPYDRMFECLMTAVRRIVESRPGGAPSAPSPHALIAKDIAEVGRAVGLGQVVVDGLRIAATLMAPAPPPEPGAPDSPPADDAAVFGDLEASLRTARSLDFPWDVAAGIRFLQAVVAAGNAALPAEKDPETALAVGVLALVWYRHHALRSLRGDSRTDLDLLRSRLREQAERLAPSHAVEAYVGLLEQHQLPAGADKDVFMVGGGADPLYAKLALDLKHHGFRIVEAGDLQEARTLYARRRPSAILVHVDGALPAVDAFCRHIRQEAADSETVLFALTRKSEPSFLLNLMDTWFGDVFSLPVNSRVVVARVSKSLSAREKDAGAAVRQGFGATFKDLSFVDLVQALGTGVKNVRMSVEHSGGRQAEIFFRQGRIVHAACGTTTGIDAVYEVIRWQDDGSFRIEPTSAFPPDNVAVPTDYILLEGSRQLDEGRR